MKGKSMSYTEESLASVRTTLRGYSDAKLTTTLMRALACLADGEFRDRAVSHMQTVKGRTTFDSAKAVDASTVLVELMQQELLRRSGEDKDHDT
jgi:hypothetical protein